MRRGGGWRGRGCDGKREELLEVFRGFSKRFTVPLENDGIGKQYRWHCEHWI